MSTYAYAKVFVYDKDKKVVSPSIDIDVNYMKSLLFGSDWPDELEGYDPADDNINIPDIKVDFVGYMKRSLLKDDDVKKHFKDEDVSSDSVCVDETFDTYHYRETKDIISELSDTEILANDYIRLYRRNCNYSIVWVTIPILADYADKLQQAIVKKFEDLSKKKSIKDSVEYYKLNDEQKEDVSSDISYAEEDIEEDFNKIAALRQMVGMLEGMKEQFGKSWEDKVVAALYLC